ncbi:MAG: type II secretion system F family protein, partial [Actinomycetes bacterium]
CELLAVCLDAGRPPRGALRVVAEVLDGPAADELRAVLQRIDLGVDEADAWGHLALVAGYQAVGRDLSRSVRSGLGLSAVLRQHAVDARKEAAAEALVEARGAGVRSVVPLMLCFLPAFMLLGVVPLFGAFALAATP